MTKIKVTIEGGRTLVADLVDNQATQALVDRLPLTITMDSLYGLEMCHRFGRSGLPADQAKETGYKVGDISYWLPMGSLVFLYEQNGEVFEQQPLGHFEGDVSFMRDLGTVAVTLEQAN